MRHFHVTHSLHEMFESKRKELAGVGVSVFESDVRQAEEVLATARGDCPSAVKDIEYAIFAAVNG
jgi:hypothetical protein